MRPAGPVFANNFRYCNDQCKLQWRRSRPSRGDRPGAPPGREGGGEPRAGHQCPILGRGCVCPSHSRFLRVCAHFPGQGVGRGDRGHSVATQGREEGEPHRDPKTRSEPLQGRSDLESPPIGSKPVNRAQQGQLERISPSPRPSPRWAHASRTEPLCHCPLCLQRGGYRCSGRCGAPVSREHVLAGLPDPQTLKP